MTKNFLEINNVTFAASAQSKVNNVRFRKSTIRKDYLKK